MKNHLIPFFLIAFVLYLSAPLPLFWFSPSLVFLYKATAWRQALWIAALCGVMMDLLSTTPFGLHPLQMVLVTLLAYRARIYFIDKPLGLTSYAIFISAAFTCISRFSLIFDDSTLPFTWKGSVTDLLCAIIGDGIYSLFFFSSASFLRKFSQKLSFFFLFFKKKVNKKGRIFS